MSGRQSILGDFPTNLERDAAKFSGMPLIAFSYSLWGASFKNAQNFLLD
jgi:hypothetical protein